MLRLFRYPLLASGLFFSMGFTPLNRTATNGLSNKAVTFICNTNFSLKKNSTTVTGEMACKYDEWKLSASGISKSLFDYAVKGYEKLLKKNQLHNQNIISIADLSKPSSEKRLYIINVKTGEILFNTLVAHGRNSGQQYATDFSNAESSFESSLGFYITTDTYNGKHGYSLRLNGCEKGFNDNASKRAIVVHGAGYVSENFIQQNGYLGRSHGCPAVPEAFSKKIIEVIKNGSCLFIYAPSKKYLSQSVLLNS